MNLSIIQAANKLRRTVANTASAGSSSFEDDGATVLYWVIYVVLLICIVLVIIKTIFLSTCEDDHECNRRFNFIICLNVAGCTVCYCPCCMHNETYEEVSNSKSDEAGCDCNDCCDCNECCLRCADGVCAGLCNACCNLLGECLLNAICSC